MSATRTLRHVFFAASLVLLVGCMPNRAASSDPDKALMYLHMVAADFALSAEWAFDIGEGKPDLGADIEEMQAAARALPASDVNTKKVATLVDEIARTYAGFEKAMPEVAAGHKASQALSDRSPMLAAMWDEVIRGMTESGAPVNQILIANREIVLAERMSRRATDILDGGDRAVTAADALARDVAVYGEVLKGMQAGNPELGLERVTSASSQSALARLLDMQVEHDADAQRLVALAGAVHDAREAAKRLQALRIELLEAAPPKYSPARG